MVLPAKKRWIFIAIFAILFTNSFFCSNLLAQHTQQINIIIEGISSADKEAHFNKGEEFRQQLKFRQAIKEYQQVISGGEPCGLESAAHYNIGLCYTWLNDLEKAKATFEEVIQTYPKPDIAVAFAEYGLAWVETKQGKYYQAIHHLQQKIDENSCNNSELCAEMQFHIGRIYAKYLHDYATAKKAFQLVWQKYPNSQIAYHPYLDEIRGDSSEFSGIKTNNFILSAPIIVDIIGIKFDYDHNSHTYDAIDIKVNNSTDIPVPEWANAGQTNAKIAYIKKKSNRKIKAKFYCNRTGTYGIKAIVIDGTGIGDLPKQNVYFGSNHQSSYITFTANGSTPTSVGIRSFRWDWYVEYDEEQEKAQKTTQTLWIETTGPHTYYTLLAAPQSPMSEPWTEVLDYSCDWARNKSSTSSALSELVEELYNYGVTYDGGSHYTRNSYTNLDLTNLLNDLPNPSSVEMDCRDFSNFIQVLLNSIGGQCQYNRIDRTSYPYFFTTNYILPANGNWGTVNWNYHQVGWNNSKVADASLKIDNDSDPTSSPHSAKLARGDMSLSSYIDKLTETPDVSSVAVGTCTVY